MSGKICCSGSCPSLVGPLSPYGSVCDILSCWKAPAYMRSLSQLKLSSDR